MQLKSKLPNLGRHIFSHMTALANEHNAVNLSQGFPDFDPDPELVKLVDEALNENTNQYAPMPGLPILRQQIASKMNSRYGLDLDWETEITIGTGATELIFASIAATVWPGDEVILIEPCYDCYRPAIEVVGGKAVVYKMKAPDFKIDWDEVGKLVSEKTKMICLCTPNNPTGTVFTHDDMQRLIAITKGTDILLLCDEVYEYMTFDGKKHISPLQYPELRQRTFASFSFGKTYHITGWKVGYCVAPELLTGELRKVHQNATYCTSHPLQKAIAKYMEKSGSHLELSAFFERKRDLFLDALGDTKLKALPCEGGYFLLFDYSDVSDESDFDFCVRLIKEFGVAAIPVSRLYSDWHDDRLIRICFAKKDDTLLEAAKRLRRVSQM
ncbi:aminotransferase class I/II-fold pyridoxal phosphate-dependent enzyme [Flavobacterium sp. MAH-1]|uniref:Aminotransferase class I/II-fold pyridoxal phosphate-dependent enzyme n=1 Tax=Flavobacterium agri TaxID=2743471 RepID=A0A7Y9C4J8_9FLAO|nr:methionine aminotransferase [Flavobacterium agri]NUY79950.1 aminotransferase class I/II-fold pyridoxal phosphate-dependent enzyme [Flavobacterium agri]NYA69975.1 aminotransferase class I/II-fold pyridoxal phosphate-dependent enzyme [Flavobacterium agri]